MIGVMRETASTYEIGDVIQVFPDDYVFSGKDLSNGRIAVNLGDLTEAEINRLTMPDEQISNPAVVSQLPTFRSFSTGRKNLNQLHRRKYHVDGVVKLKANAQSRI